MMEITVKFFAAARDLAGTDEVILRVPITSQAASVLDLLVNQYPRLGEWKNHLRVAVNCEYVSLNQNLSNGDEVAIIPPVSGG